MTTEREAAARQLLAAVDRFLAITVFDGEPATIGRLAADMRTAADALRTHTHQPEPDRAPSAATAAAASITDTAVDAHRAAAEGHHDDGHRQLACCIRAGLAAAQPHLAAQAVRTMAPALLAASRCIPDGRIQTGCVVHDGATVRQRLKDAYNAIARPCPTCTGPQRETVGMVCQTCGTDYAPEPDGPDSAAQERARIVDALTTFADARRAAAYRYAPELDICARRSNDCVTNAYYAAAAIARDGRRNPHCANCGDTKGGPFGHETSECTWKPCNSADGRRSPDAETAND